MRLFYITLLILCTGLIYYFSGIPHFSIGAQGFLSRKLGHSFLYGMFMYLLWMIVPWFNNQKIWKLLLCLLILTSVAISEKFRQASIPSRHVNINGVLFDLLVGCTVLSLIAIRTYTKKRDFQRQRSKGSGGGVESN